LPNWYVDWKVTCISPPWRYCLKNWKEILEIIFPFVMMKDLHGSVWLHENTINYRKSIKMDPYNDHKTGIILDSLTKYGNFNAGLIFITAY